MRTSRSANRIGAIGFGMVLLLAGHFAWAQELVVGKVTAFNYLQDTIDINGMRFDLSSTSKRELISRFGDVKPGLAVAFEAKGKQIVRIQPVKSGADFPLLVPPGGAARSAQPVR